MAEAASVSTRGEYQQAMKERATEQAEAEETTEWRCRPISDPSRSSRIRLGTLTDNQDSDKRCP